jgi:anti-anti-sigma regulatory factor
MVVRMTTNALCIKLDPERVAAALRQEAVEAVSSVEGEVVLDFSSVLRIDPNVVGAMEELAGLADGKSIKVVLRAVNMDIYKVLKLVKLTRRFSFLS